ncbi:MAG: hypothetical protein P4K86_10220 [Terracidiphilus sp.]|nr:hypothetical protein [Terracidiphilus sp.]MDR3775543.1 hypothetical protein [Terracidiphilus sp.]
MKSRAYLALFPILLGLTLYGQAQLWAPMLAPDKAIDWSKSGVGNIPARTTECAHLAPPATLDQINRALASCPGGQAVTLAAGNYSVPSTIHIPSNVTLRGAGADLTILNATGAGESVVNLGNGSVPYRPVGIVGGATAGSTKIVVGSAAAIHAGSYLTISETNNPSYVSAAGSGGNCNWCDGWSKTGDFSRGQIVAVTDVSGTTVTISPGLYSAYTNTPIAVPFRMAAAYAGVEDLQVYANNTGYQANFAMAECAYCWIKGVESNYTDGDHVTVYWGYHDEIRDSYFSNAFVHVPGPFCSGIRVAMKTSASLVENNIVERGHDSVMLEWGAAGNVISYNYTAGEFDSEATNVVVGGIDFHGAHPQFNLLEGNVFPEIAEDPIWGSSSQTTAYRNWVVGTNRVCSPMSGRGLVNCSGTDGHYGFQAARAMNISYLSTLNNFVDNVVGSSRMQSLTRHNRALAQKAQVEYPAVRSYDDAAYGWSFGYGSTSDDGTGTGCGDRIPPCHPAQTSSTDFFHGNFNNVDGTTAWAPGVSHALPASLYLSGKPSWWGSLPFPATGPEVARGSGPKGHSYGNPAQTCYFNVMGGSDGGAGGPLNFNAGKCYGTGSHPEQVPASHYGSAQ